MISNVLTPCSAIVHKLALTMLMITKHAFQASPTSSVAPRHPQDKFSKLSPTSVNLAPSPCITKGKAFSR
eukprot:6426815-Karenia_brevis.AAC.1